jgi:succinate dehydrogenase / fumarate reductase, cytochrome b subunit
MNSKNRPLSPHIQIYKPQISSFTSILHRATGVFLYIGVVAMCWAIVHYTYQVEIFINGDIEEASCGCWWKYFFYVLIAAWSFSLYYHLCNGIRHLFWDIGKGFDKKTSNRNGILVLISAFLMTVASFYYVFFFYNFN